MNSCTKAAVCSVLATVILMTLIIDGDKDVIASLQSQNASLSDKALAQATAAENRAQEAELSFKKREQKLEEEAEMVGKLKKTLESKLADLERKGCK